MATETAERATTRNTIQRALVLEAVQSLHNHPTSADVYEVVRERIPTSRARRCTATLGCWRTGARCCAWRFPTAPTATISSTSRITMRSAACAAACSTSTCPTSHDIASYVSDAHGFAIEHHEIIFDGVCAECQAKG